MKKLSLLLMIFCGLYACQSDDPSPEDDIQNPGGQTPTALKGFYLLNQGNMAMNKASLDYMDFETGDYRRNVFSQANPELVGGLGDVGNAMGIYGSKLYVVVNGSNKVEVLDATTGKRIKQIDIDNPRYLTFYKGKAYLSSYLGSIGNANNPNGIVAEIDTTSLKITRRVQVGRQPEELVAYNDKIYVANSGGYSPPNYESTISVIDVNAFTEMNRIEVAVNLHGLKLDSEGDLYVTSRGDYYDIPSKLFVIDTKTETVKKTFDIGVSNMVIHKDIAYMYKSEFSYITGGFEISYLMFDTKTETFLDQSFISEKDKGLIEMPYGIAVNPETDEVFITDAKDYVTPGNLYCFTPDGALKWSVETGDIPVHMTFKYE